MSDVQAAAILQSVSEKHEISVEAMLGTSRVAPIAAARHAAMHSIRKSLGWSLPKIGRVFNRHHTTVLYGIRKVELTKSGRNADAE